MHDVHTHCYFKLNKVCLFPYIVSTNSTPDRVKTSGKSAMSTQPEGRGLRTISPVWPSKKGSVGLTCRRISSSGGRELCAACFNKYA